MSENKCTGNCMTCTIFQRQYCASQLAYSNMRMLEQVQQSFSSMNNTIEELKNKIEAIQNNEATLFYPTISDAKQEGPIAQEG